MAAKLQKILYEAEIADYYQNVKYKLVIIFIELTIICKLQIGNIVYFHVVYETIERWRVLRKFPVEIEKAMQSMTYKAYF